ncbi:glutathione peroxidase [Litoreibacter arenae]|uniref:Glutathione peroxidase n=1 Tax=Litoreibacter arenae DSM 19593 TaxID=1123360 RepID=S9QCE2_9RHOB|nr:glutathione peroxidase [Litoreibacter arenae]EPX79081.1 Glutathione peroxidase [Litoreibacter arenae DSM 19593]
MRALLSFATAVFLTLTPAFGFTFASIDGGKIDLDAWKGRPVLVANTASLCAFTKQYDGLQALYDTYRDKGLVVLAVPSDDFNQELATDEQVKEFCAVNFALDLPMTEVTRVRGTQAHPFYKDVKAQVGFSPRWNFNKVLLDGNGKVVATFGSGAKPMGNSIRSRIEALLAGS